MKFYQKVEEIEVMADFLDEQGVLIDKARRLSDAGKYYWEVHLNGVPQHIAGVDKTHSYLAGACDVFVGRGDVEDPRHRM